MYREALVFGEQTQSWFCTPDRLTLFLLDTVWGPCHMMWSTGQHGGHKERGLGKVTIEYAAAVVGKVQQTRGSCGLVHRPPTKNKPERNSWNFLEPESN